jgi:hypothetical protein
MINLQVVKKHVSQILKSTLQKLMSFGCIRRGFAGLCQCSIVIGVCPKKGLVFVYEGNSW